MYRNNIQIQFVLKNIYTKKIQFSSPFLYCIVAYQNVSKRIITILTNHIVWITSLRYVILYIKVKIDPNKGPALGSADKYTTLLSLAWPIKPGFLLPIF